ncbi:hypothetical protein B0H14DRAFT_3462960 [Mycena olivaceomarginata]|nr:hypothetical protein B0H14DRAFT_3462960 [Mycena olivaceomarginata]
MPVALASTLDTATPSQYVAPCSVEERATIALLVYDTSVHTGSTSHQFGYAVQRRSLPCFGASQCGATTIARHSASCALHLRNAQLPPYCVPSALDHHRRLRNTIDVARRSHASRAPPSECKPSREASLAHLELGGKADVSVRALPGASSCAIAPARRVHSALVYNSFSFTFYSSCSCSPLNASPAHRHSSSLKPSAGTQRSSLNPSAGTQCSSITLCGPPQ